MENEENNQEKKEEKVDALEIARKAKVLVVVDDFDIMETLSTKLTMEGYIVFQASSGREAILKVERILPDVIILDIAMPDMDGMVVKAELNRSPFFSGIPVIFLTGLDDLLHKLKGFSFGIDDYITKPYNSEEVAIRVSSVLTRRRFYEEISMTDGLTGLHNVYYFQKQLIQLFSIAKRYKSVFSLAVIDVDHLKPINDTHGHIVGNYVLKEIASMLQETTRKSDIVTRYGGDEFAVIFPETGREGVERVTKRLQERINSMYFVLKDKDVRLRLSISIGIATYNDSFATEDQMFEEADANMYKEKKIKHGDDTQEERL